MHNFSGLKMEYKQVTFRLPVATLQSLENAAKKSGFSRGRFLSALLLHDAEKLAGLALENQRLVDQALPLQKTGPKTSGKLEKIVSGLSEQEKRELIAKLGE